MSLKKNSLFLLIGYLAITAVLLIFSFFFKTIRFFYDILSLITLLGAGSLLYFNFKKSRYCNWIEKNKHSYFSSLLISLVGTLVILIIQKLFLWIETTWLNQTATSQNTTAMLTIISHYPLYLLYVVLAAPIMEELVFRKVLFGNLITLISPIAAGIISCVLFSIVHADGHYLTYAAIGAVLCLVYFFTGRIQAAMLTHLLMNLTIVITSLWPLLAK